MITDKELASLDIFTLDEGTLEAASRMKNLMWTVSGDYTLDTRLDLESFALSRYVSMYDAIKQGGFALHFDKDAFGLYLAKKLYYGAAQQPLTNIAQMCVDSAVYPRVVLERPGVQEIRARAFAWLLEHRFGRMNETLVGKIKLALMRGALYDKWECEGRIRRPLELVRGLAKAGDTKDLIAAVDELYNTLIDPDFVQKHGDLGHVLAVSLEEMREVRWRDFMDEEAFEELLEKFMEDMNQQVTSFDTSQPPGEEQPRKQRRVLNVDAEAVARMYSYIEVTFGLSYLSEADQKRLNYRLCRGAHADCSLYYTDGIVDHPVRINAQYVNATKHMKNNQRLFLNSQHLIRRNVEQLTAFLRRALEARTQTEQISAYYGVVVPRRLWKVGRVAEPGRLFERTTSMRSTEFAVEILLDGSGSQRDRQGQVALQAYMIGAALSGAKIPHRMESFCAFWDYTVLQRFRDFDDPPERDLRVLQFTTSSNNRDGLAIRAAGDTLLKRPEENRILIVLSDGRPNDVIVNRPGSRNPMPYSGDYAVKDTAFEVRALRGAGVYVLGVFTGKERDLSAEKMIFGKDFAYVRDIRNFSKVVGLYLKRLLDQD